MWAVATTLGGGCASTASAPTAIGTPGGSDPAGRADDGCSIWRNQFGAAADDRLEGVAVDLQQNTYTVGYTGGQLPDQTHAGGIDILLRKISCAGTTQWTRQIGSVGDDEASAVALTPTGEIYVTGHAEVQIDGAQGGEEIGFGGTSVFLWKVGSDGRSLWLRQIGSDDYDYAEGVAIGPGHTVYVGGYTSGELHQPGDKGGDDLFVLKFDTNGERQWTVQDGTAHDDRAKGIAADAQGNVYVVGYTLGTMLGQNSKGGSDAFLFKFSDSGTPLWVRQFGSSAYDYATGVAVGEDGSVYVSGETEGRLPGNNSNGGSDLFVAKFDPAGTALWLNQSGTVGHDSATAVAIGPGGRVYVTGFTDAVLRGRGNAGGQDIFLLELTPQGQVVGGEQQGTTKDDAGTSVAVDHRGQVLVGGATTGEVSGKASAGGNDAVVIRYDASALRPD